MENNIKYNLTYYFINEYSRIIQSNMHILIIYIYIKGKRKYNLYYYFINVYSIIILKNNKI